MPQMTQYFVCSPHTVSVDLLRRMPFLGTKINRTRQPERQSDRWPVMFRGMLYSLSV